MINQLIQQKYDNPSMPLKLEDEIRENEKMKSMTGKQAKEPASSRPRRQRSVRVVGFIQGQFSHQQKQDYCFDDRRPNSLLVYLFIYFFAKQPQQLRV